MRCILLAAVGLLASSVCDGSVIGLKHANEHTLPNDALRTSFQKRNATNWDVNGTMYTPAPGTVNCTDLTTGRDDRCWAELKLDDYIRNWTNANLDKCQGSGSWANCFLFWNGWAHVDCTSIEPGRCPAIAWLQAREDPRVLYVALNIYAINQFFYNWHTQLDAYWEVISDRVAHIADMLGPRYSPPAPNGYNKFDIESMEVALLGLVTVPSAFNTTGLDNETQNWVLALHEALVMNPALRQLLYPQGVNRGTQFSIDPSQLFPRYHNALSRVTASLNLTMSSPENFLAFASQQIFSSAPLPLPAEGFPERIFYGLYTYMLSTIGSEYGVQAVVARDTNPVELATNATGKNLAYTIDCQKGLNAQGVCDAWWYSQDENAAYGLNDLWRMGHPYGANLTKIFSSLSTGQYLFENAYACKDQKPSSNGVPAITASGPQLCISQFPITTWNMGCLDPKDTTCEFLDHSAQHNFLGNCKNGGKCVPDAYLGSLLKQQKQKITRY